MGHIVDYVEWKGQEDFSSRPFNVYDSIVVSFLSYVRFQGKLKKDGSQTLRQAAQTLLEENPNPEIATMDGGPRKKDYLALLRATMESRRYGEMKVLDYEDVTDTEKNIQFGALAFALDDGSIAVSYRGTDETIVGWKENFELSFERVPAQEAALGFASRQAKRNQPLWISGHSKGGNLALYAASFLPQEERPLLKGLFLLDSPGLCPEVFGEVDGSFLDPITSMVEPGYDVVGQIFKAPFHDLTIVDCDAPAVLQHAFLSWRIEKGEFVKREKLDPECDWANQVIRDWLLDVDMEERKKFVGDFFDVLTSHGEKTLWDLGKNPISTLDKLLVKYFQAPKKDKSAVRKLGVAAFFGTSFRELKNHRSLPEWLFSNISQGLIMIVVGLLFVFLPGSLSWIVVSLASAALLFLWTIAIYYLVKSKGDWKRYRLRLWIASFLSLAYVGLALLGWEAISTISVYGAGLFFFLFGAAIGVNLDQNKEASKLTRVLAYVEIALYSIVGAFLLFVPNEFLTYGLFATGIILAVDGAYKLIR